MSPLRICTVCFSEKPLNEFRTDRRLSSGHGTKCKVCCAEECKKWRKTSPTARKKRVRLLPLNPRIRKQKRRPYSYYKARNAKWRAANPEKHRQSGKKWRERNKDKVRALDHAKRAKRCAVEGKHTASQIRDLLKKQKGRCINCKVNIESRYHIDHIIPISRGGSNWITNIQLLCPPCNISKSAKDPILWAIENGRLI